MNELANAIKLDAVDVVILWDAVAHQYPEVEFVSLPEFDSEKKDVTIAVTTACQDPTAALRFCRYVTSREKGNVVFREEGYEVADGDSWAENPEILLFSGAMLRPALEESIRKFEEREGVTIRPVYNGCGVLVSQMKAGEKPDAYFSCDESFMTAVEDQFGKSTVVSANEMVILAENGNPKSIENSPGSHQAGNSARTWPIPRSRLSGRFREPCSRQENLYQAIVDAGNLKMESATGDFLVNQIKASSLDAVIVYRSNALAAQTNEDDYEVIGVQHPDWVAVQPYAVAKESKHTELMNRFLAFCVSEAGKGDFLRYGFRWEMAESAAN